MTGGWKGSTRRSRLPADWESRRRVVIERAGGRCEHFDGDRRCVEPGRDVDHVVHGDNHALSNLQLLCPRHHLKKTALEGGQARAKKYNRHRPAEPHPGLRSDEANQR